MPTSATGRSTEPTRARPRDAGFTLVELLVVIVVLGVVLSLAALSLNRGGRDDALARVAERLATVCRVLADEAVYRARPLGLDLGRDGYRIVEYRDGEWRDAALDGAPLATHLPPGIELRGPAGGTYAAADTPDLVLLPNGDFRLQPVIVGDRSSNATVRLEPHTGLRLFAVVTAGAK